MVSKAVLLMLLGGAAAPLSVWAQASGEGAETGPPVLGEVAPQDRASQRSPLWMAVDAHYRQRDAGMPADRRLSAEQRHELREQIRRAAMRAEAGNPPMAQQSDRP
jgi:hypothetical protein